MSEREGSQRERGVTRAVRPAPAPAGLSEERARPTDAPPRATGRQWLGLAVLALPALFLAMDLSVLYLAVPALSADLAPSSTQLLWIMDVYGFLLAGFLVTMGTLGDRIGRRRLLLLGAGAFAVTSVLAAYSTSAEMLIVTRALLGIAGATLAPSTLALIRNMFLDPRQRTAAIGVWVASLSAGGAIGPLFGGVLLEFFWWGSVFLLGVPVMLVLLVAAPALLPEYRDAGGGRLDLASVALSLAAILPVVYGLKQLAQDGAGWPPVLAIAAGLIAGAAFVRRQRALADPLVDLRLFRTPAIGASLAVNTLAVFVALGATLPIAQYLQLVLGLSPLEAGLVMLPFFAGFIVGSIATPVVTRSVRPSSAMAGGMVLAAGGFVLVTLAGEGSGLPLLVVGLGVLALGLAPAFTLVTDLVVGSAPAERAGSAASLSETSSEFGGALGIAILGSIGTAVYRGRATDAFGAEVPAEAAEAARDTIGGAVAAAERLPADAAAALVGPARDAFTAAMTVTSAVSAGTVAVLAVVAAVLLRDARPGGGEPVSAPAAAPRTA